MNFVEREAGAAANVDKDALRALNGIVFEQGAGDGAVGGIDCAVRAGGDSRAHDGVALAAHDGFYVSKVTVDDPWDGDDIRDTLHGLAKNIVRDAERVKEAGATFDGFH